MNGMTIAQKLNEATAKLEEVGIENARLDAEVLLAYVLNTRRLALYVHIAQDLEEAQIIRYDKLIARRLEHIPVAYLTGHKEFMGMNFAVTNDVLIPRQDTEVLAQGVIEHLQEYSGDLKLADIGTGSGAICISILKYIDHITAAAVDISADAIDVAEFNAEKFNVSDRINFYKGNLLEPLTGQKFDVIVSNPPYIPSGKFKTLQPEISFEPHGALDGGTDGLDFYKQIIDTAPEFLNDKGFIVFEVGIDQSESVIELLKANGGFGDIQVWKDLANIDRVVAAWKK